MRQYIKLPDAIWQYHLTSTELMVYVALRRHVNVFGRCIIKHRTIARLIGRSEDTVSRTTRQLAAKGLLCIHECKNKATGNRIANGYTLELLGGGYTKVPALIFALRLPKSDFKVYLYLLKCKGKGSLQAVPSLAQMVSVLHMSKRTVIDAVKHLDGALFIQKETYRHKRDGRLGHNRHFVLSPALRFLTLRLLLLQHRAKRKQAAPSHKAAHKVQGIKTIFKYSLHKLTHLFKGLQQKNPFYFLI